MRIAWIGGNHRRHLYYVNQIAKYYDIAGGIIQERENILPEIPTNMSVTDKRNWERHFVGRDNAERQYYWEQNDPDIPLFRVRADTLNSAESATYIQSLNIDVCLVFGAGMIRDPLLSALPDDTINLHLGLSPRYRGAATLFWPFYFLEPNWAGVTFHRIVHSPDAGKIIHQSCPTLYTDDGIHDVSCRAVLQASNDICDLLAIRAEDDGWMTYDQTPEAGKNFLESDFKAQHLRMIYNVYDNDIVNAYLTGSLRSRPVNLKRQKGMD